MEHRDFCYWLQGFFELTNTDNLTEEQVKMIKEHLSLTFKKVTTPLSEVKLCNNVLTKDKPHHDISHEGWGHPTYGNNTWAENTFYKTYGDNSAIFKTGIEELDNPRHNDGVAINPMVNFKNEASC